MCTDDPARYSRPASGRAPGPGPPPAARRRGARWGGCQGGAPDAGPRARPNLATMPPGSAALVLRGAVATQGCCADGCCADGRRCRFCCFAVGMGPRCMINVTHFATRNPTEMRGMHAILVQFARQAADPCHGAVGNRRPAP